jgi:glycosyltransferase involved in cell wall biosynthesis
MNSPKVSIGLPVFNGANYLRRSVQSLLAQTCENFELIISDNASTDETEGICRELARGDARIQYHRNETNIGAARNYNQVFHLARGKYFKWAAHDDECHPAMVQRCVEVLERSPAAVTMVYPLGELIDEQGRTLRRPLDRIECKQDRPHRRLCHLLSTLNMCDPVFGLYKSEYLKRTQLIGPFFGADYVLLGELVMIGEIWELEEVLFRLRAHEQRSMQAHASARARAAWYDPAVLRKRFIMPDWERMVWELLKSARRAPLPAAERLRCCLAISGTHYYWRLRNAAGRLKRRLKTGFRREEDASSVLYPNR